ncbi:hypothetical protein ACI5KX_04040 [Erythrobacter sp. GH1-10]|uniref:hypothetical protein n=1 Tax=Erythrobacter sp. GH1-10 TaxID=3349334 RepID=UPI003877B513
MKHALTIAAAALVLAGCNTREDEPAVTARIDENAPAEQATEAAEADAEGDQDEATGTMIRGGSDTAGTTPPKGSKLQRAD